MLRSVKAVLCTLCLVLLILGFVETGSRFVRTIIEGPASGVGNTKSKPGFYYDLRSLDRGTQKEDVTPLKRGTSTVAKRSLEKVVNGL